MKKILFLLIILFVFITHTFAGGSQEDVTYRDQLATMSWNEIVELAKQEGEVNWYIWYFIPQFREIAADFENKYGIKVTIPEGDVDGNNNKVIAEASLSVGSVDLLSFGVDFYDQLKEMLYGPIDTIIPNMDERKTGFPGFDTNGYALTYWGNQVGLAYNPLLVDKKDLPQTFNDLDNFIKKYKFGFNFEGGGAGPNFIFSIVRNISDDPMVDSELTPERIQNWEGSWKWFKDNSQYYTITKSNADSLTRLSDGEFALVPAWEDHAANLINQGAINKDIKVYIPKFGMPGGGNVAAVVKNAPHPAAALVLLEWLTSSETQTSFVKTFGAVPQNSKVVASDEIDRSNSTSFVPSELAVELKKEFSEKILQTE